MRCNKWVFRYFDTMRSWDVFFAFVGIFRGSLGLSPSIVPEKHFVAGIGFAETTHTTCFDLFSPPPTIAGFILRYHSPLLPLHATTTHAHLHLLDPHPPTAVCGDRPAPSCPWKVCLIAVHTQGTSPSVRTNVAPAGAPRHQPAHCSNRQVRYNQQTD